MEISKLSATWERVKPLFNLFALMYLPNSFSLIPHSSSETLIKIFSTISSLILFNKYFPLFILISYSISFSQKPTKKHLQKFNSTSVFHPKSYLLINGTISFLPSFDNIYCDAIKLPLDFNIYQ